MKSILTQSGLKKALLGRGKSFKTWRKKLGRSWMRKPWQLFSFACRWSVGWVFYGENNILVVGATSGPYLKKSLANWKQRLFLLRNAWRYTYQVSLAEFSSIINDLDKIEVKIEDEDQALLLLHSLSSPYKSFVEAIIYRGKSTINVKEVKEHLLKKDKIDN